MIIISQLHWHDSYIIIDTYATKQNNTIYCVKAFRITAISNYGHHMQIHWYDLVSTLTRQETRTEKCILLSLPLSAGDR